ncbi:MAG: hypothetical protein U1C73_08265 [Dietzia sp.]|nr:hypothetical protein [Dietzia sp.]
MSATDRLDEIQARADEATDGPWEARHRADLDWLSRSPAVDSDGHEPGSSVGLADAVDPLWGSLWPSRNANADAEFIAHARTDVPELIYALRAVLDVLDRELAEPYNPESERLAQRARTAVTDALGVSS